MKAVHAARAEGLPLTAQMAGRPIGVMMGIGTALNPFTVRPSYKAPRKPADRGAAPTAARPADAGEDFGRHARRRRRSPSWRSSARSSPSASTSSSPWAIRRTTSPAPRRASPAIAQREGRTPEEVAYDYMLEDGQYLYFPVVNYVTGDHAPIFQMLNDPACLLGLSDGARTAPRSSTPARRASCWRIGRATGSAGRGCRWSCW